MEKKTIRRRNSKRSLILKGKTEASGGRIRGGGGDNRGEKKLSKQRKRLGPIGRPTKGREAVRVVDERTRPE